MQDDFAFNINENIKVKLKPEGVSIYQEHYEYRGVLGDPPRVDKDGYSKFQLWDFMRIYGSHIWLGGTPPFETTIVICKPQWQGAE